MKKGATKNVSLKAEYCAPMKDLWGNTKAGLSISGAIDRKDFGLTLNVALKTGGVLVGEEIKLVAEIQLKKL
jgi:polyisoprenoid-binding protein YceI